MKQHQLKALLAVAEAGTIRGAARQLNLSQAALTKSLKELEEQVGAELLIRSYRGVQLTAAGKILQERARVAHRQLDIARSEIHALTGRGQIRLRSEEHTSELQSLMRISYAVFCLKKKK